MPLPAGPAGAGNAADTDQQHFTTLSHPGCSGKCRQQLMYFSPVSLAAPSSPCWHCLWTISMPEAALQGLTTACRKWYNCKDFVVVVKILKTSRTKKKPTETTGELKVIWALGRGQRGGHGRGAVCTAVCRLVALRKSGIFCWRKALLPLSPSINGCAAPRGAPASDYISLPSCREMSSHFPWGALTAKWIERFSGLFS